MIKILTADDHPIMREGLRQILAREIDLQLVAEADNGYEILKLCTEHAPDVLLLDVAMPGPGLLETIHGLMSGYPRIKILILSAHPENDLAVRAIKAGALGYITKNNTPTQLAKAIRCVYKGDTWTSTRLVNLMVTELRDEHKSETGVLSRREYQVLQMLGAGMALNAIADKLSVSPKTVSTFRARILAKLDLRSNADLVRYVLEQNKNSSSSSPDPSQNQNGK